MAEDAFTLTVDGQELSCLRDGPEDADTAIIMVHGFTNDRHADGLFDTAAARFADAGYAVLRFDCRGWGASDGDTTDFTLSTEMEDLEHVYAYAQERYTPIGVIGFSMGAAVTVAARVPACAYALWSPAFRLPALADTITETVEDPRSDPFTTTVWGETYRFNRRFIDELRAFDRERVLSRLTTPTLLVHGTDDEAVPPAAVRRAEELLDEPAERISVGGGHHFGQSVDTVIDETLDWFSQHCGGAG